MHLSALLPLAWSVSAALMLGLWFLSRRIRNVGIVDVGWATSVLVIAVIYASGATGTPLRRGLIAAMVLVWGSRLATHLLRDRVIGRPEDGRYAALRRRRSPAAALDFFWFFQAQAVLALVLSVPLLLVTFNRSPDWGVTEWLGLVLFALAFAGESTADRQLKQFKARPESRGKTCREGLWRYSRHPNYFFEWVIWVAFATFAATAPWGVLAWTSPALMLLLLFRVTGIPETEAQALRSRGDDYRRYQRSTSAFVPWFPGRAR